MGICDDCSMLASNHSSKTQVSKKMDERVKQTRKARQGVCDSIEA